jgi:hypothetical protein
MPESSQWDQWLAEDATIQCKARWVEQVVKENMEAVRARANEALKTQQDQLNATLTKSITTEVELECLRETFGEAIKRGITISLGPKKP